MQTVKQVERALRDEMQDMNLPELCDFAHAMGVRGTVLQSGTIEQLKDECVRLEVHAFVH